MTDTEKIILTGIVTGGSAVTVFVLGQIIQKIFIEPIQEFQKTKSRVAGAITKYYSLQRYWTDNEGELVDMVKKEPDKFKSAYDELQSLAADLRAWPTVIPFYSAFSFLRMLPSKRVLKDVTMAIEMWASIIYSEYNAYDYTQKIDKGLKLNVLWYYDHTGGKKIKKRESKVA